MLLREGFKVKKNGWNIPHLGGGGLKTGDFPRILFKMCKNKCIKWSNLSRNVKMILDLDHIVNPYLSKDLIFHFFFI